MEVSRPYLELAKQLLGLSRSIRRHTDALLRRHHDISGPELFALRAVERGESNPMRLADRLDMPPSSASRLLDRLVEVGLLARSGDPDDRRKTRLSLTPRGLTTVEDARRLLEESLRAAFGPTSPELVAAATETIAALALDFDAHEVPA